MPRLATENDSESATEDVIPHNTNPSEQVKEELADAVEGNGQNEDDDEDMGEEAEEYVVEKILDHDMNFDGKGEIRYEVKWKGYEKKSDRTWEPQSNLEGAREALEEYWEKIGGEPKRAEKGGKKRPRLSTVTSTPDKTPKKPKRQPSKRELKMKAEADDGHPAGVANADEDWTQPPPDNAGWEDQVQAIETLEKDENEMLWAFVVWNAKNKDGSFYRTKAKLHTVYEGCPQKMLHFYENHMVFTSSKTINGDEDVV